MSRPVELGPASSGEFVSPTSPARNNGESGGWSPNKIFPSPRGKLNFPSSLTNRVISPGRRGQGQTPLARHGNTPTSSNTKRIEDRFQRIYSASPMPKAVLPMQAASPANTKVIPRPAPNVAESMLLNHSPLRRNPIAKPVLKQPKPPIPQVDDKDESSYEDGVVVSDDDREEDRKNEFNLVGKTPQSQRTRRRTTRISSTAVKAITTHKKITTSSTSSSSTSSRLRPASARRSTRVDDGRFTAGNGSGSSGTLLSTELGVKTVTGRSTRSSTPRQESRTTALDLRSKRDVTPKQASSVVQKDSIKKTKKNAVEDTKDVAKKIEPEVASTSTASTPAAASLLVRSPRVSRQQSEGADGGTPVRIVTPTRVSKRSSVKKESMKKVVTTPVASMNQSIVKSSPTSPSSLASPKRSTRGKVAELSRQEKWDAKMNGEAEEDNDDEKKITSSNNDSGEKKKKSPMKKSSTPKRTRTRPSANKAPTEDDDDVVDDDAGSVGSPVKPRRSQRAVKKPTRVEAGEDIKAKVPRTSARVAAAKRAKTTVANDDEETESDEEPVSRQRRQSSRQKAAAKVKATEEKKKKSTKAKTKRRVNAAKPAKKQQKKANIPTSSLGSSSLGSSLGSMSSSSVNATSTLVVSIKNWYLEPYTLGLNASGVPYVYLKGVDLHGKGVSTDARYNRVHKRVDAVTVETWNGSTYSLIGTPDEHEMCKYYDPSIVELFDTGFPATWAKDLTSPPPKKNKKKKKTVKTKEKADVLSSSEEEDDDVRHVTPSIASRKKARKVSAPSLQYTPVDTPLKKKSTKKKKSKKTSAKQVDMTPVAAKKRRGRKPVNQSPFARTGQEWVPLTQQRASEETTRTSRSGRKQTKPLAYWANERQIDSVHGVTISTPEYKHPQRKRKRKRMDSDDDSDAANLATVGVEDSSTDSEFDDKKHGPPISAQNQLLKLAEAASPSVPKKSRLNNDDVMVKKSGRTRKAASKAKPKSKTKAKDKSEFAVPLQKASDELSADFSSRELAALKAAMAMYPATQANYWPKVASHMKGRTAQQCHSAAQLHTVRTPVAKSSKAKKTVKTSPMALPDKGKAPLRRKKVLRALLTRADDEHAGDDVFDSTPLKGRQPLGNMKGKRKTPDVNKYAQDQGFQMPDSPPMETTISRKKRRVSVGLSQAVNREQTDAYVNRVQNRLAGRRNAVTSLGVHNKKNSKQSVAEFLEAVDAYSKKTQEATDESGDSDMDPSSD